MIRRIAPALLAALLAAGCQPPQHWASLHSAPIGPYEKLSGPVEMNAYRDAFCALDAEGRLRVAFQGETGSLGLLVLPAELSKAGMTEQLVSERGELYAASGGAEKAGLQMLAYRPSPGGEGLWLRAWAGPYRCRLAQGGGGATGTVVLDAWTAGEYADLPYVGVARVTFEFCARMDADRVAEIASALEAKGPPAIPEIERFWMTPEEVEQMKRQAEEKRRQWLGLPASQPATEPASAGSAAP